MSQLLFADLNILYNKKNPKETLLCLKQAVALGYDTLAVNVELLDFDITDGPSTSTANAPKRSKKSNKQLTEIPPAPSFLLDDSDVTQLTQQGKKLRIYKRLTLGLSDTSQVHNVMKHPTLQQYDILAIWPKTEEMFTTIIKKIEVDLISFDIVKKSSWVSRKKLVQMAIDKGIAFEIVYAPALSDSSIRRDVFVNGREIVRATKGKGLILSSSGKMPIELRSPYDVANLGILFGLTAEQGAKAVSKHCKDLLLHAQSKKTINGVISIKNLDQSALDSKSLLSRLLNVPEFRAEVEASSESDISSRKRCKSDEKPFAKKMKQ